MVINSTLAIQPASADEATGLWSGSLRDTSQRSGPALNVKLHIDETSKISDRTESFGNLSGLSSYADGACVFRLSERPDNTLNFNLQLNENTVVLYFSETPVSTDDTCQNSSAALIQAPSDGDATVWVHVEPSGLNTGLIKNDIRIFAGEISLIKADPGLDERGFLAGGESRGVQSPIPFTSAISHSLIAEAGSLQDQCKKIDTWGGAVLPIAGHDRPVYDVAPIFAPSIFSKFFAMSFDDFDNTARSEVMKLLQACHAHFGYDEMDTSRWEINPFGLGRDYPRRFVERMMRVAQTIDDHLLWAEKMRKRIASLPNHKAAFKSLNNITSALENRDGARLARLDAFGRKDPGLPTREKAALTSLIAAKRSDISMAVQDNFEEMIASLEASVTSQDVLVNIQDDFNELRHSLTEPAETAILSALKERAVEFSEIAKQNRRDNARSDLRDTLEKLQASFGSELAIGLANTAIEQAGLAQLSKNDKTAVSQLIQDAVVPLFEGSIAQSEGDADQWKDSLNGLSEANAVSKFLRSSVIKPAEKIERNAHRVGLAVNFSSIKSRAKILVRQYHELLNTPIVQAAFINSLNKLVLDTRDRETVEDFISNHIGSEAEDMEPYRQAIAEVDRALRQFQIPVSDVSVSSLRAEPNAQQMLAALFNRMENVNSQLTDLYRRCSQREFETNPLLLPQCLTVLGSSPSGEVVQLHIRSFTKVGCGKLGQVTGFACDFRMPMYATGGILDFGSFVDAVDPTGRGRGRFFETTEGWMFEALR